MYVCMYVCMYVVRGVWPGRREPWHYHAGLDVPHGAVQRHRTHWRDFQQRVSGKSEYCETHTYIHQIYNRLPIYTYYKVCFPLSTMHILYVMYVCMYICIVYSWAISAPREALQQWTRTPTHIHISAYIQHSFIHLYNNLYTNFEYLLITSHTRIYIHTYIHT